MPWHEPARKRRPGESLETHTLILLVLVAALVAAIGSRHRVPLVVVGGEASWRRFCPAPPWAQQPPGFAPDASLLSGARVISEIFRFAHWITGILGVY
jgi:hypothetical protein